MQGTTATDLYKPLIAFALSTDVALDFFIAAKQMSHQQWKIKQIVISVHLICGGFVLNISSLWFKHKPLCCHSFWLASNL
jgi:hypothetical protein